MMTAFLTEQVRELPLRLAMMHRPIQCFRKPIAQNFWTTLIPQVRSIRNYSIPCREGYAKEDQPFIFHGQLSGSLKNIFARKSLKHATWNLAVKPNAERKRCIPVICPFYSSRRSTRHASGGRVIRTECGCPIHVISSANTPPPLPILEPPYISASVFMISR